MVAKKASIYLSDEVALILMFFLSISVARYQIFTAAVTMLKNGFSLPCESVSPEMCFEFKYASIREMFSLSEKVTYSEICVLPFW